MNELNELFIARVPYIGVTLVRMTCLHVETCGNSSITTNGADMNFITGDLCCTAISHVFNINIVVKKLI